MRKLLNTLYVMSEGAYLSREGETVVVRVEKEVRMRLPIHTLDGIVCFGPVMCSPGLMGLCGQNRVLVSFMSMTGRFMARVQGPISGNVRLRREQYRRADNPEHTAGIARAVLMAKVANCRSVLLRAARDRPSDPNRNCFTATAGQLNNVLEHLRQESDLKKIRGLEGQAATCYFDIFDHLISAQKEDFVFTGRSRRPPLDKVNALLSFHYSLLAHDVVSALEAVGLDPQVGFLHRDRPGRPGLALDIMEEFRPYLADRLALALINRQQVAARDFNITESGAVLMEDNARKRLLTAYQKRKREEITHPFLNEKIPVGLLPFAQAMLLSRYLRGDLDGYPPFLWK